MVNTHEFFFTFYSSYDKIGPLRAMAIYPCNIHNCPILVVQHGYGGNYGMVKYSAQRMAERGFFCLCLEIRGRGQSAGMRDDGGIEILDIYDGIAAAKTKFVDVVDPSRISMIGYSNGGGNVFFANVRSPFMFNASMALFGIPDYAMWYKLSPLDKDRENLQQSIGGSPEQVPEKYLTRSAVLAASNLSGTRFHIAFDEMETRCPNIMSQMFYNEAKANRYNNIFMHISKKTDKDRFEHGYNEKGELSYIEDIFINDIETSLPQTPEMPSSGTLVVAGYVVTPRFQLFLNKGDDVLAVLKYDCRNDRLHLTLRPITKIKAIKLLLDAAQENKKCSVDIEPCDQLTLEHRPNFELAAEMIQSMLRQ